MLRATDVIQLLNLQPHPVEGGAFRETYRSAGAITASGTTRSTSTAIYYLLSGDAVSEMHRLPGDEVYHFYLGDPLETLLLAANDPGRIVTLGPDLAAGQVPQLVIPGGVWQGSVRRPGPNGFTLIGATMAPGFDYADYVRGSRDELSSRWPLLTDDIRLRTPHG
jgi:predicted cupin superfamily sugar epimerase